MSDFRDHLFRAPDETGGGSFGYGMFRPTVYAGRYRLSVQGSGTHYSSPRELYPSATQYVKMEVAIFGPHNEWVKLRDLPITDDLRQRLSERWDSGETPVGGYVPVTLIQELVDVLCAAYLNEKSED